jgi:hypothetical protein
MTEKYKERIPAFLTKTKAPMDVEKTRVACKIGNWNTALKHCLELFVEGKIKGQKTSKSWVFWVGEATVGYTSRHTGAEASEGAFRNE